MKTFIFNVAILTSNAFGAEILNEYLDERIKENKKMTKDFVKNAAESEYNDELIPIEKKVGELWVEYLKDLKKSDNKLQKAKFLRLEYMNAIVIFYYDFEYEDSNPKKELLQGHIQQCHKRIEVLEGIIKSELSKAPAKVEVKPAEKSSKP